MTDPTIPPIPHPFPDVKELPPPACIGPEAEAIKAWIQSVVDARILSLIPFIKRGMAEGVYAQTTELLTKVTDLAERTLDDRDEGDAWKNGPTNDEE